MAEQEEAVTLRLSAEASALLKAGADALIVQGRNEIRALFEAEQVLDALPPRRDLTPEQFRGVTPTWMFRELARVALWHASELRGAPGYSKPFLMNVRSQSDRVFGLLVTNLTPAEMEECQALYGRIQQRQQTDPLHSANAVDEAAHG